MKHLKTIAKDMLQVIIICGLATLLAFAMDAYGIKSSGLLLLFLLAVLIITIQTTHFIPTFIASFILIFSMDYLFLEPRYSWTVRSKSFVTSAIIFLIVAFIVNTLVSRLQSQINKSKYNANLHKKLYKASQDLLGIRGKDRVIEYSNKKLSELTGCETEFFFDIDKDETNEALKWCFKNSAACGYGEVEFQEAGYKYVPIRSANKTVGVVSIDCTKNELSTEAEECLTALLSQITIAFERETLEAEKRQEAAQHEREQIKAMVMKEISHDMYTKITSIHKNAKEIKERFNLMEDKEITEKIESIETESDYLTQTVDNLLDITKEKQK
ncbi:MAG: DUF4118 domain-containing protein [Ruminococcaceae bacterium]|nr:DUF4118 domain-containing protein [Oscillospiraceae bacterium]